MKEAEKGIRNKDEAHRQLNSIGIHILQKKNTEGNTRYRSHKEGKDPFPVQMLPELNQKNDRREQALEGNQRDDLLNIEEYCQQWQGKEYGAETGKPLGKTGQKCDEDDEEILGHETSRTLRSKAL